MRHYFCWVQRVAVTLLVLYLVSFRWYFQKTCVFFCGCGLVPLGMIYMYIYWYVDISMYLYFMDMFGCSSFFDLVNHYAFGCLFLLLSWLLLLSLVLLSSMD